MGWKLLTVLLGSPLFAQSLQVVPSTAPRGGGGSLLVTLSSPAGKEPIALQWKIAWGPEIVAAKEDIAAEAASAGAGKTITCAPGGKTEPSTYKCILAGGVNRIGNGPLFRVNYKVRPGVSHRVLTVRISEGLAVLEHQQTAKIPPAEGSITIR